MLLSWSSDEGSLATNEYPATLPEYQPIVAPRPPPCYLYTIHRSSPLYLYTTHRRRTPFYRPMLSLGAVRAPDDPEERTRLLAEMLLGAQHQQSGVMQGTGGAAVVYVTLQRTAEEVAEALVGAGLDARPYHAGLPPLQREVCFQSARQADVGRRETGSTRRSQAFTTSASGLEVETRGGGSRDGNVSMCCMPKSLGR